MKKLPSRRRCLVAVPLGLAFGVLCAWLASQNDPTIFDLHSPMFWTIVWNRLLIGFFVALAGAYKYHPVFGFRFYPALRGIILGALISLALAFGALLTPSDQAVKYFWLTILAGAIYGLIIDLIATKVGGEGKNLLV
ncbi:MAG: hypothetical protein V1936_04615 [Patescibacteria group bacterium]